MVKLRRALRGLGTERALAAYRLSKARDALAKFPAGDPESALAAARAKTLIFTVTAGRSGTTYLTRLMALFARVRAVHEEAPGFECVLRPAQKRPELARAFWLDHKLPAIARHPEPIYLETSNVTCKGFLEPLLELGLTPRLILLNRAPRAVALSYLGRNTVPGRSDLGIRYMLHPGDPGVLPLPGWRRLSDYQLCFWSALDIERRQVAYRKQILDAGGTAVETSAQALGQFENLLELAHALDLVEPAQDLGLLAQQHAEISRRSHNPNPKRNVPPDGIARQEQEVWQRIAAAAPKLEASVAAKYPAGAL
ncbi:MAG: hypothetical protein AAF495_03745 [Pseudomonadota bacterium]